MSQSLEHDDDRSLRCCKVLFRITKCISESADFHTPCDKQSMFAMLQPMQIDSKERFENTVVCNIAALNKHIKCLRFAHEIGCPWTDMTATIAVTRGIDLLKYVHTNGCPWDATTCRDAARYGMLSCLRYAYINGCPWDHDTCNFAASGGHLKCLKYAHKNGCPVEERASYEASLGGHLDCLKYLVENGCPLDDKICGNAALNGDLKMLKYAYTHGCPFDHETYINVKAGTTRGHKDCLIYVVQMNVRTKSKKQ